MSDALYSETRGHGPDVVLLHGWAMNLRVFDGLSTSLSRRCRVTAIDLPGHGRSSAGDALDAPSQLARIRRHVPPGASLIGWSLGGQFALQLARDPTLSVSRLVMICSTPRFVSAADWPFGLPIATLQRFASQLQHDSAATISDFLELQVRGSADAVGVLAALKHSLAGQGSATDSALRADLELLECSDLRAEAAALALPTLVIAGQYDRVTPPTAAEALARLLPNAQLRIIARAGHAPFLSHAQQVLDALRAFLDIDAADTPAARASP